VIRSQGFCRRIFLVAGAAASLAGCGAGAPPPPPKQRAPERPAVEVVAADLASGSWGEYRSPRFDLTLPLPDGPRWRVEDSGSPWLEARHEAAATKLLVRTWFEAGASRATCEERARLWRDLPAREGADVVDRRRINVPPGFDTIVEVGVRPETPKRRGARAPGEIAIAGFAMAFGGWAHRCFAYVLTTSASGKEAERLVAVRLATMVELSLLNVTIESETDPAVPREPVP
jgi:hypothetical protein